MRHRYRVMPDVIFLAGNHGTEGNLLKFKVERRDWLFGWTYVTSCETREGGEKIIKHFVVPDDVVANNQ